MFDELFDSIVDEVIEAITSDLSNPDTVTMLRDIIDDTVIRVTGVNVKNPLIYPYYKKFIDKYESNLLEVLDLTVSDPPYSVDAVGDTVKEEVTEKIDTFTSKLKKRIADKKEST